MTNSELIAIINCIGALQDVSFPVSVSYKLSQNLENCMIAYKPYEREYAKANGDVVKIKQLLELETKPEIVKIPLSALDVIVQSDIRVSMHDLNIFKHHVLEDELKLVDSGGCSDVE
jgi:hypothetical protein